MFLCWSGSQLGIDTHHTRASPSCWSYASARPGAVPASWCPLGPKGVRSQSNTRIKEACVCSMACARSQGCLMPQCKGESL